MKILIINNSGSRWTLADSYVQAFQELGHEIFSLNLFYHFEREQSYPKGTKLLGYTLFTEKLPRKISQIIWNAGGETRRRILLQVRGFKPDMILVVGNSAIEAEILREIKSVSDSCLIFWYLTDPLPTQDSVLVKSVPFYDCILTFSKFQAPLIYWFGAKNVFYLPFGYDPRLHKKVMITGPEEAFYGSDVAYLGTWQPHIENWVSELPPEHLKVWGNRWDRVK